VIEEDPGNQGDVVFQSPANSGTTTQTTPLMFVFDSHWVEVHDLQIEGVQASGCASGTCGGTGCASACVSPSSSTGELNVTYPSNDLPASGVNSGISLENVFVDDSNFTCLYVNYADYVDVRDSSFTNCGLPGGSAGVYLGVEDETFANNTVEYSSGNGIYSTTTSSAVDSGETISGNTIDNSGGFASNPGLGGSGNLFDGNEIFANASGGLVANWGATIQDNSIYQNHGPGIELNWNTGYGCGCENVIENNSFYQDAGEEIDSTSAS
jgi:hypothetical protein